MKMKFSLVIGGGVFTFLLLFNNPMFSQNNTFPASGNVGIGTTTPGKELEVVGTVKADTILFPDGTKLSSGLFSRGLGFNSVINNLSGNNNAASPYSFIGAGHNNLIQSNAQYGVIFGGSSNQIQNALIATPIFNFKVMEPIISPPTAQNIHIYLMGRTMWWGTNTA